MAPSDVLSFFRDEYELDHTTAELSVPYASLWNGPVMGGGAGVSVHAAFRVATERTVFAMPECAIGIFPDVGGTHFLAQLPRHVGNYLALTGRQLTGIEAYACGIATHYVHSSQLDTV